MLAIKEIMMTPLNITDIENVHKELEHRLHMLTNQDGGRAHRHRGVLIDALREERTKNGTEQAMRESATLRAELADKAAKLEAAKLAILEKDRELSNLRAQIGARRGPPAVATPIVAPPADGKEAAPTGATFRADQVAEGAPPAAAPAPAAPLPRGATRLPQAELTEEVPPPATPPRPILTRKDGTPAFKPCFQCDDVMRCAQSHHCPMGLAPEISDEE